MAQEYNLGSLNANMQINDQDFIGRIKKIDVAFAGLAAGIVAGMKKAVSSFASLQETTNLFNVTFEKNQKEMNDWVRNMKSKLGVAREDLMKFSGSFSMVAKGMGISTEKAKELSKEFTQMAFDISSFRNQSPERVFLALQNAMTGETENLKGLGVVIRQTDVETRALAMGLAETTSEITKQDKALATTTLLREAFAKDMGDLERTGGSLTNQFRALKSNSLELFQSWGSSISKFLTPLLKILNEILSTLGQIAENAPLLVDAFTIGTGGIAAYGGIKTASKIGSFLSPGLIGAGGAIAGGAAVAAVASPSKVNYIPELDYSKIKFNLPINLSDKILKSITFSDEVLEVGMKLEELGLKTSDITNILRSYESSLSTTSRITNTVRSGFSFLSTNIIKLARSVITSTLIFNTIIGGIKDFSKIFGVVLPTIKEGFTFFKDILFTSASFIGDGFRVCGAIISVLNRSKTVMEAFTDIIGDSTDSIKKQVQQFNEDLDKAMKERIDRLNEEAKIGQPARELITKTDKDSLRELLNSNKDLIDSDKFDEFMYKIDTAKYGFEALTISIDEYINEQKLAAEQFGEFSKNLRPDVSFFERITDDISNLLKIEDELSLETYLENITSDFKNLNDKNKERVLDMIKQLEINERFVENVDINKINLIKNVFSTLNSVVQEKLEEEKNKMLEEGTTKFVEYIGNMFNEIKDSYETGVNSFVEYIKEFFNQAKEYYEKQREIYQNFNKKFIDNVSNIQTIISELSQKEWERYKRQTTLTTIGSEGRPVEFQEKQIVQNLSKMLFDKVPIPESMSPEEVDRKKALQAQQKLVELFMENNQ